MERNESAPWDGMPFVEAPKGIFRKRFRSSGIGWTARWEARASVRPAGRGLYGCATFVAASGSLSAAFRVLPRALYSPRSVR
jgi:hypothetical protein